MDEKELKTSFVQTMDINDDAADGNENGLRVHRGVKGS
jgi:hypothetical protein